MRTCTRIIEYTPTLVIMAKRHATAAVAERYAGASQNPNGSIAAFKPKTTSSKRLAALTSPMESASADATFTARSAMFKVPSVP